MDDLDIAQIARTGWYTPLATRLKLWQCPFLEDWKQSLWLSA